MIKLSSPLHIWYHSLHMFISFRNSLIPLWDPPVRRQVLAPLADYSSTTVYICHRFPIWKYGQTNISHSIRVGVFSVKFATSLLALLTGVYKIFVWSCFWIKDDYLFRVALKVNFEKKKNSEKKTLNENCFSTKNLLPSNCCLMRNTSNETLYNCKMPLKARKNRQKF